MTTGEASTALRPLLTRTLVNGGTAALGHAALLLSLAVLAWRLGPEDYGRYALVLSWVTVLTLLAIGGGDQTLLRFVPAYRLQGDWARLHGVLRWARRRALWASLGLSAAGAAGALLLGDRLAIQTRWTFLLGCALVPLSSLGQIRQFTLRALHRFALGILPQQLLAPLLLTAAIVLLSASRPPLNSSDAMVLAMGTALLSLTLLGALERRCLPSPVLATPPLEETRQWGLTAVPLLLASGMYLAMANTDILMLGLLTNNTETGVYHIASRLSGVMAFGLTTVNTVLAPLLSELCARGVRERLQQLVSLASLGTTLALLPVAMGLALYGHWLLGLFGPAFSTGYLPLLILSVGQVINAGSGSVGYLLIMSGYPMEVSRVLALAAALNLLGNLLLIPAHGAVGAAASTAGSMALWNLILVWRVRRLTGIRPTALSWLRRP